MTPIRPTLLLPIIAALALLAVVAHADEDDHERARRAFEAGEIVPLTKILDRIDSEAEGDILEIELEDDDGGVFVYEIKLLAPDGRIVKRYFDARSGAPLGAARDND